MLRFLRVERKAVFLGHAFSPELVQTARRTVEENLDMQRRWYENGQFWKGDGDRTVQIDYIQHNAMAFLFWHMLNRPTG